MKAGFFNLYRWGRYDGAGHRLSSGDSAAHQERERFAVAAVAFSLRHHDKFRSHFLHNCCGIPSKLLAGHSPMITVEENKWGDLTVWVPGVWACIIEFKLGDGLRALDDWQNPSMERFWEPGPPRGYGLAIRKARTDALGSPKLCKYLILGWTGELRLSAHPHLEFGRILWEEVVPPNSSGDLFLNDLWDCLGNLGVPAFQLQKFKGMKLAQSTESSAQMFKLLEGVARHIGLNARRLPWNVGIDSDSGEAHFGLDIPRGGQFSKLSECIGGTGEFIAWLGYECPANARPRISIWIYAETKDAQQKTQRYLKTANAEQLTRSPDGTGLFATRTTADDDRRWFEKMLSLLRDSQ